MKPSMDVLPTAHRPTVLMTGGTGFLGSHLLKKLCKNGYRVVLLKRSFSDPIRIAEELPGIVSYDIDRVPLKEVFEIGPIDMIVHCATDYGRKRVDPTSLVESNLVLPLTLLQLGAQNGTRLFISTDTVLDKRVSHYSLSKKQFLDWLQLYSDRLACVNVALEHFYGPGDDTTKFVSWVVSEILKGVPELELTPGRQRRDFIYIEDAIEAFIKIFEHSSSLSPCFRQFDVGSGQTVEIRELVTLIKSLAGNNSTELRFGALPYRRNEVMESKIDLGPLEKLGWRATTLLSDGLTSMIRRERERILCAI